MAGAVTGLVIRPASSSRSESPFGIEPLPVDLNEFLEDGEIEVGERTWDTIEMRQR